MILLQVNYLTFQITSMKNTFQKPLNLADLLFNLISNLLKAAEKDYFH